MKITRYRKVQRFMSFFKNNYGFRLPYQVLIDGTFCVAAKRNKVNIAEQLPKYLGGAVKILTTQCVIIETENFGRDLYGALVILKQFKHHRCGHEGKPVPAFECLKGMLGAKNESRYIIASQDRELQDAASCIPGVPVLYLHGLTLFLQPPSETSTRMAHLYRHERFEVNTIQQEILLENKKRFGIQDEFLPEKKKKKRIRGPNPLSCKKKKKKPQQSTPDHLPVGGGTVRKRKRVKIPLHVKEHLRESVNTKSNVLNK